jgi:hypothetical protein
MMVISRPSTREGGILFSSSTQIGIGQLRFIADMFEICRIWDEVSTPGPSLEPLTSRAEISGNGHASKEVVGKKVLGSSFAGRKYVFSPPVNAI